jgi:hypothetical protein
MNVRLPDLSFDAAMTSANYEAHGLGFDIYNDRQVYKYWKVLDAARALAANAPLQGGLQFTLNLTIPLPQLGPPFQTSAVHPS